MTITIKKEEVVYKPWGKYEVLCNYPGYKVKILTINPGQRISLQRHKWRDEHWFIVYGAGEFSIDETEKSWPMYTGDSYDIEHGFWHRVTNKQQIPLVIVEIQTGDCFEEDIERKEDDYNRV